MKQKHRICTLFLMIGLLFSACKHRHLEYNGNTHYVRVYVDEQLLNITEGYYDNTKFHPPYVRPKVFRAMLCDRMTGKMIGERFLQTSGMDFRGYYVDGYIIAPPGDYHFLAYSFGDEMNQIKAQNDYYQTFAFTTSTSGINRRYGQNRELSSKEELVNQPDHLWVVSDENIQLNGWSCIDTLLPRNRPFFRASSIIKSYYLQLKVEGGKWVSSASAKIGGFSSGTLLHNRQISPSPPVEIDFHLIMEDNSKLSHQGNQEETIFYTTFNVFGKLPGPESRCYLDVEFLKIDGSIQREKMEISPQFESQQGKENQWLLIEETIKISPPEYKGGFEPEVGEWENEQIDIMI